MIVYTYSIEELNANFKAIISEVLDEKLKKLPSTTMHPESEYLDDFGARLKLGGGRKPLSKHSFNKLRREGKIKTYYPSPGRTAYLLSNLTQYMSSVGADCSILPSNRLKAAK